MHPTARTSLKQPSQAAAGVCPQRENTAIFVVFSREADRGSSGTLIAKVIHVGRIARAKVIFCGTRGRPFLGETDDEHK
jgi:hypothetical protein